MPCILESQMRQHKNKSKRSNREDNRQKESFDLLSEAHLLSHHFWHSVATNFVGDSNLIGPQIWVVSNVQIIR